MRGFDAMVLGVKSGSVVLVALSALLPIRSVSDARVPMILQGVQEGENFFRNLSLEYSERVQLLREPGDPAKPPVGPGVVIDGLSSCHLVRQQDMFYFKQVDRGRMTRIRGQYDRLLLFGYDGETLRTVSYQRKPAPPRGDAHIKKGEKPFVPFAVDPLQFGFRLGTEPLSEYLRKFAEHKSLNGYELLLLLDGKEKVRDEPCLRLKLVGDNGKEGQQQVTRLWLAVNLHYVPLRSELFSGDHFDQPFAVNEVARIKEIDQGVLIPWVAVKTTYAWKDGKRHALQKTDLWVTKASLRPAYQKAFFQEIPIPEGIPVNK